VFQILLISFSIDVGRKAFQALPQLKFDLLCSKVG